MLGSLDHRSSLGEFELVQVLDSQGRETGRHPEATDLCRDELIRLYRLMVVTRALDVEFVNLQRQGQLALYPSSLGQEAVQVGTASVLRDIDWVAPGYREHGVLLTRGVDPMGTGVLWRGMWHGGRGLVQQRVLPVAIPIATQCLHGVGVAHAAAMDGTDEVVATYFGDGATSEGDFHEAMNIAAVLEAPVVFVCENNGWAISVPVSDQTRAPSMAHKAVGYGMPGLRVDGNDVLACRAVMASAVERARRHEGPTLIEAVTYRRGPHTTNDDPSRYRTKAEEDRWVQLDPLSRYTAWMRSKGVLTDEVEDEVAHVAATACAKLRADLIEAKDSDPLALFDHMYETQDAILAGQRLELASELAANLTGGQA